jgi:hypothetical protein
MAVKPQGHVIGVLQQWLPFLVRLDPTYYFYFPSIQNTENSDLSPNQP